LRSLAPIQQVNLALARLATGNFTSSPVQVSQESEIGELAENYNRAVMRMMTAISEREQKEISMRQFIADASHELRTPLTVILGYVDALQKQSQNEKESFRRIAVIIQAEGRRMYRLIENLGMLTRLDQNAVTRIEIIDPSELVQEIVDALRILEPERRFVLELASDALLTANREEFYAAIRNIVENALKYAPEGPITIRTSIGSKIIIEIVDEGPGISPEEMPLLFDRFFRGERQRGMVTGSGLGLPIAARAIQRAGGEITVYDNDPTGTIFRISLPRQHFS
jgi:two-component system OmpR family sensor kinase